MAISLQPSRDLGCSGSSTRYWYAWLGVWPTIALTYKSTQAVPLIASFAVRECHIEVGLLAPA